MPPFHVSASFGYPWGGFKGTPLRDPPHHVGGFPSSLAAPSPDCALGPLLSTPKLAAKQRRRPGMHGASSSVRKGALADLSRFAASNPSSNPSKYLLIRGRILSVRAIHLTFAEDSIRSRTFCQRPCRGSRRSTVS